MPFLQLYLQCHITRTIKTIGNGFDFPGCAKFPDAICWVTIFEGAAASLHRFSAISLRSSPTKLNSFATGHTTIGPRREDTIFVVRLRGLGCLGGGCRIWFFKSRGHNLLIQNSVNVVHEDGFQGSCSVGTAGVIVLVATAWPNNLVSNLKITVQNHIRRMAKGCRKEVVAESRIWRGRKHNDESRCSFFR